MSSFWSVRSPWLIIASAGTQTQHTGNTNETVLKTITVPAGAMGPNGILRILSVWAFSGTNTKTARVRFNGIGGTVYAAQAPTTQVSALLETIISNRNAANSQVGAGSGGTGGFGIQAGALITSAIDTTGAVDIVLTGQLTNTGETISVEAYHVELIPRP